MQLFQKIVKRCCEFSAWIGMLTVGVLLVMTVCDVLGRFFFKHPFPGTFELTKLFFALSVFYSLAISQYLGENLGITVFYEKFPRKLQGLLDFIAAFLGIATFSMSFYQIFKYAARMKLSKTVTSVLRLPIYPWIYVASIGILIMVIALLWELVGAFNVLKGGKSNES
jgi:TRAP-type transport system small permease protein